MTNQRLAFAKPRRALPAIAEPELLPVVSERRLDACMRGSRAAENAGSDS